MRIKILILTITMVIGKNRKSHKLQA
jgi:hypothetical protein